MYSKIVWGSRGKKTYYLGVTKDSMKECTEEEFDAAFPAKIKDLLKTQTPQNTLMQTSKAWPRKSDALGVHPSQKAAAEAQSINFGVPTEFDGKTGQAILRDNAHQRELQKAMGWQNNDAGYAQVTG